MIAAGRPEDVAKVKESYTGKALAKALAGRSSVEMAPSM